MIISTVSLKGGSGKTTTAINLAVYLATLKYHVCIIDTDVNKNIERWHALRATFLPSVDVYNMSEEDSFRREFERVKAQYDMIIIDGRPAVSTLTGYLLALSDVVLFPIRPSPLDLWTLDEVFLPSYMSFKEHASAPITYFLMNSVKVETNLANDFRLMLHSYEIETGILTLKNMFGDRVSYAESLLEGLGVIEASDKKAKGEVSELFKELLNDINKRK